jgi:predicted alpha/beta superfamily hydrolase
MQAMQGKLPSATIIPRGGNMKRTAFLLALLAVVAGTAAAGEPITIGETVTIESKIMGEERTILISTPPNYEQNQERFPVLYMTDGDAHLTHTRGTVDFLARNGLMPSVIIVGVTNTDRTRDLTPTRATITQDDGSEREFPTSGGADKFLDFFEDELFPYVDSNYRTQPFRLFTGHSLGGLFALNVLFTRPSMFAAVISVSPSLMWDDELPVRQASSFFDNRKSLNATLFVAMANEEEGDPRPNRLDRLEEQLEKATTSGFEWQVMRMPEETHGSVVLRAHYWGLRKVFNGWRLPTDPETGTFTGTVDDIKKHYAGLSKRFGFTIAAPENTVNQVGYQLLGRDDTKGAIAVFRYNVELYPESANVYDSLGEALENAGQLEEAMSNYARAVENAKKIGDERLEIFTTNRDRVKEQLDNS